MKIHRWAWVIVVLVAVPSWADARGWGTIQGKVVWGGDTIPPREKLKVNKDKKACLKNGPLYSDQLVIDKNTKGVRWVMVWLVHPENYRKPVRPIHPDLVNPADEEVSVAYSCCKFEPHVLGMREGQTLVLGNDSDIPHNPMIIGGSANPKICQLVPPRGIYRIRRLKASTLTMPLSCTIHPWMQGYVRCFDHPYFAVTDEQGNFTIADALAGKWNLVVWHETGYVVADKKGTPIVIEAKKSTNIPEFVLKPRD